MPIIGRMDTYGIITVIRVYHLHQNGSKMDSSDLGELRLYCVGFKRLDGFVCGIFDYTFFLDIDMFFVLKFPCICRGQLAEP